MATENLAAQAWRELALGVRGAIDDIEEYVASERARRLQRAVDWTGTLGVWLAWLWLAALVFAVLFGPILDEPRPLATADYEPRESLFIVLGLALGGPIAIGAAAFALLFTYRLASGSLGKRLPRAFAPLSSPIVILIGLAVAWVWRVELSWEFWHYAREIRHVLALAAEYSPVL
jgi:hypothetical protein